MKNIIYSIIAAITLVGCCECPDTGISAYELKLPDGCKTPDGMALGNDGNIYLSINQLGGKFADRAKIVKIDQNDNFSDVIVLPVSKETNIASPMGICFGSDGNIYVADNQMFGGAKQGSRILRVKMVDGKAVSCAPVVEGLRVANGIACANGKIYLTDCMIDMASNPIKSAVYAFDISKLDENNPIKVNGLSDKHVFRLISTRWTSDATKVGCDGICSDKDGNLYVNNFGEASTTKFVFDKNGKVVSETFLFKGKTESCDGIQADCDGNLWIADFVGNAVAKYDAKTGLVSIVKKSPAPSSAANGELNAPAEAIRRGDKVYISNMNVDMAPHKSTLPHSMTVLNIK